METNPLFFNEVKKRFELEVDGHIPFIEYIIDKYKIIYLTHTEVLKALGRKGVGKAIVEKTLYYIKENGYTLAPLCAFVAAFLKRNPERQAVILPNDIISDK
jgi:predicted GNAT family acetyltransferase